RKHVAVQLGTNRSHSIRCSTSFRGAELVDEFVVDDGGGQSRSRIRLGFFEAHDAPLAHDITVLLAGDFFRHLENHLHQSIHWQLLGAMEENSTLADVFDDAFVPRAGLVHAIAQWQIQFQAARTGYPRRTLLPRVGTTNSSGLGLGMLHTFRAAHGGPVVLVFRGAEQANLIVVAIGGTAWPGELVGAAPKHKHIHDFLWHVQYFQAQQPQTHGHHRPNLG